MDIQFNILLSTLSGSSNTTLQPNQLFLRLLSSLSGEDSHSPIVQKIREFKDRNEDFSKRLSKFLKKSKETLVELNKELEALDDDPVLISLLKEQISNNQKNIHASLSPIEPTIKQQISVINRLSDHISPPTEELFTKKVKAILDKNPIQQVPSSKKNRCTICLDTESDILIKRTCKPNTTNASTTSSSPNTTTTTTPTTSSTTTSATPTNTTSTTTTTTTPISTRSRSNQAAAASHLAQITQQHSPKRSNCFCEAAVCNCGPTMCEDCLIKHYWVSTSKGMKSFGKCVCCRAEFCLKDIYKVEYVNDETNTQDKSKETLKVNDSKSPNSTTTTTTSSSSSNQSPSSSKKRKVSDSSTGSGGGSDNKRYKEQQSQINVKDETTTFTTTTTTTTNSGNNIFVCSNKPTSQKSKRKSGVSKVQINGADKTTHQHSNSNNNNDRNKQMDDKDDDNDPNSASRESNPFKKLIFWK